MSLAKLNKNSSDMNEIILAPCDAGYVQSCTGLIDMFQHEDARPRKLLRVAAPTNEPRGGRAQHKLKTL
jgi:hypothetical protein